jgi:hypothetical protein
MLHQVMIVLHAAAATLSFGFGALTVIPHLSERSRLNLFDYYFIALIAMIVFLAGAILAHLSQLGGVKRAVFAGLFLLSLYMLLRGSQARAALLSQRERWLAGYIDHVGFTLISLFEGFIIVTAINLAAPAWLTAAVAVLGVVAGSRMLHRPQQRGSRPGRAVS